MGERRGENIRIKLWNDRQEQHRQKELRKNYQEEEMWYRVVSDENSIYEYDLKCVGEKTK